MLSYWPCIIGPSVQAGLLIAGTFLRVFVVMKHQHQKVIEMDVKEIESLLRRVKAKQLQNGDYEALESLGESVITLLGMIKQDRTTIGRLRKMLFGASTEKTDKVTDGDAASRSSASTDEEASPQQRSRPPPKGHGRNGVDAYPGAEKIDVSHESLQPGDACPQCGDGTVYETTRPGVLVRITGEAPVQASVYRLQKLRCHLCGKVFTAAAPKEATGRKYDATAVSMIALLKYGSGLPFNRLQGLQGHLGIPLPASTQWDLVRDLAQRLQSMHAELVRQAAEGEVLHNDDTTVKILALMGRRAEQIALYEDRSDDGSKKKRKGLFTTGIVSTREGRRIALFFSGRQHAGENLSDVLGRRCADLSPPIQMCDALSRNLPAELKTIVANCLAHGRRQFVDVAESFPEECRYVLEALKVIYHNDATTHERELSPQSRLQFHQAESSSTMKQLHAWLARQFDDRVVEPNSTLGGAVAYMLRHWEKLTLFLRVPGAPLDNNICERALKKAIIHRKNSLFYKTENGARVGDLYMSLIHTCELCGANPLDYLTELDRHTDEIATTPQRWMPWNYRDTLEASNPPAIAPC